MSSTNLLGLALLALMATFFLTAIAAAFRRLHKKGATQTVATLGNLFFYRRLQRFFFPDKEFEILLLATAFTQNITRFAYAALAIVFLFNTPLSAAFDHGFYTTLGLILFIVASLLVADVLPRQWGRHHPRATIRLCAPFASSLLTIAFPISFIFIKMAQHFGKVASPGATHEPIERTKEKIFEIIQDAAAHQDLEPQEVKLIESCVTFRDRVVREVMIPRVDLFSVSASASIRDAAAQLEEEGYSRVPVYKDGIDNIVGILMYKDILAKYMEADQKGDLTILDTSVESIQKPVLYTPETKKILQLLQEFRNRQVHLAVVVDEYGGTEGIVTIEDILEEIVGEIADEYDEEEALFQPLTAGGWIVDARMTILDVEEQLGVKVPQDGDYDSVGGYIFHRAGTIPSKGFIIEHDDFKMEILSSGDRCVEKVKLIPTVPINETN